MHPKPDTKHTNHFHLLRLVLALLVLLAHAPELRDGSGARELLNRVFHTMTFGTLAVAGFFILSGYLIAQSWDRSPEIFGFIRNRVLRIYPGFIVASLISIVVAGMLTGMPGFFSELGIVRPLRDAAMLRMPGSPPVYPGQPFPYVNGSLWTIEYEFRCYALVLVLGVLGLLRNRRWVVGLWTLLLLASLWPDVKFLWQNHWVNLVFGYADLSIGFGKFFVGGVVCYLFREQLAFTRLKILLAALVLALALFWKPSAELAVATVGAYLLFAFAFWRSPLLTRLTPRYDISYGAYLYGWPLQKAMLWQWPDISPWWLFFWSALGACVCGAASWLVIERPFLALKESRRSARIFRPVRASGY